MSFKKSSLAVALLLVALMTFGGCGGGGGGGGGGDSPGPGTGSNIDGTWKVSSISYGGSPFDIVSSVPPTFPVRMIYDESTSTYEANVNNGADVACTDSAGNDFSVYTVSGLRRSGSSERYEADNGTLELIGGELVVAVSGATITLTRATGPGPGPGPDPDPDPDPKPDPSEIDGTWKMTSVYYSVKRIFGEPAEFSGVPSRLEPETFPLKVTRDGNVYKFMVGTYSYWEASWVHLIEGYGWVSGTFTTADYYDVGGGKYEQVSDSNTTIQVGEDANTLVYTTGSLDSPLGYNIIYMTRQ